MNNSDIHLISYGDNVYKNSKVRLFNEANDSKWFRTINIYEPKDLDNDFVDEFKDILSKHRGGGYWLWKYNIILNKLKQIDYNDFLIYIDAGCTININGHKRLDEYINMIKNNTNKIISFKMDKHKEKVWTTKQIFDAFNVNIDSDIANSGQNIATIKIMQKCPDVIKIFENSLNIIRKDHLLITDYYNKEQEDFFKENRHDQSIYSITLKIMGSISLNFYSEQGKFSPFIATRKR